MLVRVAAVLTGATVIAVAVSGCGNTAKSATAAASRVSVTATPRIYRVLSGSMVPTLPIGTKVTVGSGALTVGAIVVYHPPEGFETKQCGPTPHLLNPGGAACAAPVPGEDALQLIKRIVAVPGDEIYIREGRVYRRAHGATTFAREHDAYIRACGLHPDTACDFPAPIRIPAGYWFVMGDNRGESNDSRFYGPVPTAWLVGVVSAIHKRPTL